MAKLTPEEIAEARRYIAIVEALAEGNEGSPSRILARYLARALAELEALRATTKAMREADAICDQVYEDTMAEYDRG